jgi:hypothetical protein
MNCPVPTNCWKGYAAIGFSWTDDLVVPASGLASPNAWLSTDGTATITFKATDLAKKAGSFPFIVVLASPTGVVNEGQLRPSLVQFNITIVVSTKENQGAHIRSV